MKNLFIRLITAIYILFAIKEHWVFIHTGSKDLKNLLKDSGDILVKAELHKLSKYEMSMIVKEIFNYHDEYDVMLFKAEHDAEKEINQ